MKAHSGNVLIALDQDERVAVVMSPAEAFLLRLELMGAISYLESLGVLGRDEGGPTVRALEAALATLPLHSMP
jgi:hypothetical protein